MGVSSGRIWKQLCWTCEHACNKHSCVWVRTLKKRYKGTKLDNDGYIIECPKYKHDGQIYNVRDKCKSLGITYDRYKIIKITLRNQIYKNKNINSVEDYLKYQEEKKKRRVEKSRTSVDHNKDNVKYPATQYAYALKKVKELGLNMSAVDYIEKYILPRKNRKSLSLEYHREYNKRYYRKKKERELNNK